MWGNQDQLVSLEVGILAKEVGYPQNPYKTYNAYGPEFTDGSNVHLRSSSLFNPDSNTCVAPTQTTLQKWLREKYNIHIITKCFWDSKNNKATFASELIQIGNLIAKCRKCKIEPTYEEALEVGLKEGLIFIKKQTIV